MEKLQYPLLTEARIKSLVKLGYDENHLREKAKMPIRDSERVFMRGKFDDLLDTIYAPDPDTGLPSGDLAIFVNKNASPEVRQFIIDNLMSDYGRQPAVPEGNDDIVIEFIRRKDETRDQYAMRVSSAFSSELDRLRAATEKNVISEPKTD